MGFMQSPIAKTSNKDNYDALVTFFNQTKFLPDGFLDTANDLSNNGIKYLLALDDGTVIIDTGKSKSENNTIDDYIAKSVNLDNHNTRPEILQATLSSSGVGSAERFSSSNGSSYQYYAVRLGNSVNGNIGTLRVAYNKAAIPRNA